MRDRHGPRFKADASEGAWSLQRPSVGPEPTACDGASSLMFDFFLQGSETNRRENELSHIKHLQDCSYDPFIFLLFSEQCVAKPAERRIYTILFVLSPPQGHVADTEADV